MKKKHFYFYYIYLVAGITLLSIAIHNNPIRFQQPPAFLLNDIAGSYLYLPACLQKSEPESQRFGFLRSSKESGFFLTGFYQAGSNLSDGYVIKDLPGYALLLSPFFLTGQALAAISGYQADGLSVPYQVAIFLGGLVYLLAGLWFLWRILRHFFEKPVAHLTLGAIFFTTDLLWIFCYKSWIPDGTLFFIFTFGVWNLIKYHEKYRIKYAILVGLSAGLSVLIKPAGFVFLPVLLLWGVYDYRSLKQRFAGVRLNRKPIVAGIVTFLLLVLVPFVYWKSVTGHLFYDTWGISENLKLLAMHLPEALFSQKNGLFRCTPVFFLLIPGYFLLAKLNKPLFYTCFIPSVILMLFIGSLPPEWYEAGIGRFDLTGSIVLAALPLGYLIQWVWAGRWPFKLTGIAILLVLSAWNIMQTVNSESRSLPFTGDWVQRPPDSSEGLTIYYSSFETGVSPAQAQTDEVFHSGKYCFNLDAVQQFSPGLSRKFSDFDSKQAVRLRVSAYVYYGGAPHNLKVNLVVACIHNGSAFNYQGIPLNTLSIIPHRWNHIVYDYYLPPDRLDDDFIQAYFWNTGGGNLYLDDFKVEAMKTEQGNTGVAIGK